MYLIFEYNCVDCLRMYNDLLARSVLKKITASPNITPVFVPPNVNTSTPASMVNDRKASRVAPSAAVALQIRAPSMCTSMFISWAASQRSFTSCAEYNVPNSVA